MKLAGIKLDGYQNAQDVKDDEFTYTPVDQQEENVNQQQEEIAKDQPAPSLIPFANDGSFLELMKKKLAAAPTDNEGDDNSPPRKKQAVYR